jgi:PAS domain S-box-containing protein
VTPPDQFEQSDSALLETLVLEAPVAFAFYDTDLRYRRINRMLADINGFPMADHIGRRPTDVLPPALGTAVEMLLAEVLRTHKVIADDDFTAVSPVTGDLCHYQSQWFPARDEAGAVIGVAVLVTDVTARRRSEDALRRSQDRTARLQRATSALGGALTTDDVRRVITHTCESFITGVQARVILVGERAVEDPDTQPTKTQVAKGVAKKETLALPLMVSGAQIGTLTLRWPDGERVERDERSFLESLAGQCAIALERARLYERQRSTAAALQLSLLPAELPDARGIELAARFRPGAAESDVGGDWYDAFTLPDGRLVLVVGDVMGKGVIAAAGMGRLRAALRALAFVDPLPEAVLRGLDRVFSATEEPDQIATLVYVLINPVARRAAVGGAGHLPLVLLRSGQAPALVDAGSGSTPLGWPEPRVQQTMELGPGDILMGLTDGLVERRGYDLDEGLARVLEAVAEPAESLDALVEQVTTTMLGHTAGRDDATLLAVRFVP